MRGKAIVSVLLVFTVMLSAVPMATSPAQVDDSVIVVHTNNYTASDVLRLVDLCVDTGKPVLVYTEPLTVELEKTVDSIKLNTESGDCNVESSTVTAIPGLKREYTVITPDRHIRTVSYTSDNFDLSAFDRALQNEYNALRNYRPAGFASVTPASYIGDNTAYDQHWIWDVERRLVISAVDDGDGWTAETSYSQDIWRSLYDYDTSSIWWASEWIVTSKIDDGDYKEGITDWTGPWISERYLKVDASDEELWDWGPTTSTGEWSYSIKAGLTVSTSGAGVNFGVGQSWSESDVTITDKSSHYDNYVEWSETFLGPDYTWWPVWRRPCSASHNSYISYRGALWYASKYNDFDFSLSYNTKVTYDHDYVFLGVVLLYTRTTYSMSDSVSFSYDSGYELPPGGGGGLPGPVIE